MPPQPDPLRRLLRAAARPAGSAPPPAMPPHLQAAVLSTLRQAPPRRDAMEAWFPFLPLCRAGLAVAVGLALLSLLLGLRPLPPDPEDGNFPNPVLELTYLP